MDITVQTNLAAFNATLGRYATLVRLTPPEALAKQGHKLAFALRARLSTLKPAKGSTRADRLAAIKAGGGIRVRPGAFQFAKKRSMATASNISTRRESIFMERTAKGNVKRNGRSFWQIAVDRELSIRESGRGYLSLAGRMKWVDKLIIDGRTYRVTDRINREVGRAGMKVNQDGATLSLDYSNPAIVEGLERPQGRKAISHSLADARADMLVYINRKLDEQAKKAGLK